MLKIFRKIRFNHLREGKIYAYLKYAIGEIILVVIGILIAVSINNYNEKRKQRKLETSIYEIIYQEMLSDTLLISQSQSGFASMDSIYSKILSGQMTNEDYINCELCANVVGSHSPYVFKNKGYQMLKNTTSGNPTIKDTLTADILTFYSQN